ncbi:kinase-like domain-containing protein [Kalaharituber pfeilii]|nr:kinase-like domain-containing protein [Kalaharituber pfeilii]
MTSTRSFLPSIADSNPELSGRSNPQSRYSRVSRRPWKTTDVDASASIEALETLDDLFHYMQRQGAQFEVFGTQDVLADVDLYSSVDKPYKASDSDVRGRLRRLVAAIKRPIFVLPASSSRLATIRSCNSSYVLVSPCSQRSDSWTDIRLSPSSSSTAGFGTARQLHDLRLEVFALCHDSLRSHSNIVRLLAWGFDLQAETVRRDVLWKPKPIRPVLVVEHANCTLSSFLTDNTIAPKQTQPGGEREVQEQVLEHLLLGIARGLVALHTSDIIHGDIKPDNILIFPCEVGPYFCIAKLSDFGLSLREVEDTVFSGDIGNPGWTAPELDGDGVDHFRQLIKCDYFSLGLVAWSISRGSPKSPLEHQFSANNALGDAISSVDTTVSGFSMRA